MEPSLRYNKIVTGTLCLILVMFADCALCQKRLTYRDQSFIYTLTQTVRFQPIASTLRVGSKPYPFNNGKTARQFKQFARQKTQPVVLFLKTKSLLSKTSILTASTIYAF